MNYVMMNQSFFCFGLGVFAGFSPDLNTAVVSVFAGMEGPAAVAAAAAAAACLS